MIKAFRFWIRAGAPLISEAICFHMGFRSDAPECEVRMYSFDEVKRVDPEIAASIEKEIKRQNDHIELIASENWVSKAVMAAMGSPLTNKYAEGYSGKRYYGGCQVIDEVETLAIERAKKLFGCDYANVQPHSGASANLAVEFAILNSIRKILTRLRKRSLWSSTGKRMASSLPRLSLPVLPLMAGLSTLQNSVKQLMPAAQF